jgi:hypothetical protein
MLQDLVTIAHAQDEAMTTPWCSVPEIAAIEAELAAVEEQASALARGLAEDQATGPTGHRPGNRRAFATRGPDYVVDDGG